MIRKWLNFFGALLVMSISSILNQTNATGHLDGQGNSGLFVKQGGKIAAATGQYQEPRPPYSTFKAPLAFMGFNSGFLTSKDEPKLEFKEEYEQNFQSWYSRAHGEKYQWCQAHTPETFMRNSVVWFSHQITNHLGKDKFQNYVNQLDYGNKDVSGTDGKGDGLFNSWLGTSLKISPKEQVAFLEKLLSAQLSKTKKAEGRTREVMFRGEIWNGWKLFGKTGGGSEGTGWFIGWLEKQANEPIIFALYLDKSDKGLNLEDLPQQQTVGLTAKEFIRREIGNYFPEFKELS